MSWTVGSVYSWEIVMNGHKEEEDKREKTKSWEEISEIPPKRQERQVPPSGKQELISEETRRKAQAWLDNPKNHIGYKEKAKKKKNKELFDWVVNGKKTQKGYWCPAD